MAEQRAATPWAQFVETAQLVRLAVGLAYRASPWVVTALAALVVAQAALAPVELALARWVVDRAALDLGLTPPADPIVAALPLAAWIGLAAAALALRQVLQPVAGTLQAVAGDRVAVYVGEQLILAANRWRGLARFEDPGFADDLNRARRHAARGGLDLIVRGARLLLTVLQVLGFGLVLAALHPLLPVGLVLATVPLARRQAEYQQRTSTLLYMQTPEARRLDYYKDVLLTPGPAQDVRLYGLGPFFGRRYDQVFARTVGQLDALRTGLVRPTVLASALAAAAAGAVYVFLVWRVAQGISGVGDLVLYGGAAAMLQSGTLALATELGFLPWAAAFLPSLGRVLRAPPDLPVPDRPRPVPRPIRTGVAFEDVTFAYPDQPAPVLRGFSCALRPGECVALVGLNGAGKTTAVKLLMRLYDPDWGRVLVDGVDLRDLDPVAWRQELGVVFQDFVRYELTAAENIGLGQPDSMADAARVRAAAERAGALDLVEALPRGFDTRLGREFGGRELSGGEWQKLALARAFMRAPFGPRSGCQVLVLDEPTAALDVETEHAVYTRFRELTRGRTTILISHRFSTVRLADPILYLTDGAIREEGTHEELLARGGEYARLYGLQAARYLDEAPGVPS